MAELARSLASLRITGPDLRPEEVTAVLGCQPSKGWATGDVVTSFGVTRTTEFGLWSLEADETSPADLDVQVQSILGSLTTDESVWSRLASRYTVNLFCGWFMERGNEGVTMAPETLLALGVRGVYVDVDLYSGSDSDDE